MLQFILLLIVASIITFVIIKLYYLFSYKSQTENFKSATYIYLNKKINFLPTLLNEIKLNIGETDEVISLIKIRNQFNDQEGIRKNLDLIHECNRSFGVIFTNYPNLLENYELSNLRNQWYEMDANLNSNANLYIQAAQNYNAMFSDFICSKVISLLKYEQEII